MKADELLKYLVQHPDNTPNANQLHVLCRLGVQISERRYEDSTEPKNEKTIRTMALIYIKSMQYHSALNKNDWVTLYEWHSFTLRNSYEVSNVLIE